MLSRRLFEGPDIEKLLARIQSDIGPSAQVVSAEKVRRGGVGGFFARETYQVVVEGPEQPTRQFLRANKRKSGAPGLAEAASGADAVAVPSTEGATFAELLRRLTEDSSAPASPRLPQEGVAVPVEADGPRIDAVVDDDLTAVLTELGFDPAPGQPDGGPDEPIEAASQDDWQAAEAWLSEAVGPEPVAEEPVEGSLAWLSETAAPDPVVDKPGEPSEGAPAPSRALQPVPLPGEERAVSLSALSPMDARPALRRMGVPRSFLPGDDITDLVQALYRSLGRVPAAPAVRLQPGDVMVVIGDAGRAFQLAGRLSVSIGLDPASIVVASLDTDSEGERPALTSGETAGAAAVEWSTLGRPTIVAISAAPGSGREAWAANVLRSLQPAAIWGVVEATRKPEDVAAWSRAIGHVDALALEDLERTTTPAAVLSTGIPVALIDGQLASAEAWTAVLSARLRMAA